MLKSTLEYINSRGNNDQSYEDDLIFNPASDEHWKWRFEMVGRIAEHLDMERFGIKGLYLIGSTKNANAGPCSDIDLLVHSCGDLDRDKQLKIWLEGWGYCLSEMNFHKTGCQSKDSLIDLHIITDEDIRKKDSYARLIGAISDGARPIKFTDQH
jgi:DNA polymerase sigma